MPMDRRIVEAALALLLFASVRAAAQSTPGWGRVSLFASGSRDTRTDGGSSSSFTEYSGALTIRSGSIEDGGFEYGLDARGAEYPSSSITNRFSLYEAYVGAKTRGGVLGLRVGQMWLSDLGALGSFAGLLVEVSPRSASKAGRFRLGVFGGLEPNIFESGYAHDVRKGGGYIAFDGPNGRRHVLGYVQIRNGGLTERSVLTTTNFVPIAPIFFLYQAAEYDLSGPGGLGKGGLNYFFANLRVRPIRRVELQGVYHHGRSIDARTITNDELNGRPIDSRALDGLLFESVGGRLTVEVFRTLRIYAGYTHDRTNQGDSPRDRVTAGFYTSNLVGTGIDVTVSDDRIEQTGRRYDAWYASIGRSLGPRVYLSADYATSLSVLRQTGSGGITVETRPRTRRYGFSGIINLTRYFSVLLTGEQVRDDTSRENRGLAGLTFRF
jgi:hypothetical protein